MALTTRQDQEMLDREYPALDGKQRAESILSSVIGGRLKKEEIDLIKMAVIGLVEWHQQQHPSSQKCDYCELVRVNLDMSLAIEFWHTRFHAMTSAAK